MATETVTLPLECADCGGPVTLQNHDWPVRNDDEDVKAFIDDAFERMRINIARAAREPRRLAQAVSIGRAPARGRGKFRDGP